MSDTLSLLSELMNSLQSASAKESEKWWSLVMMIEDNLEHDKRRPKDEWRLVEQLRKAVTSAIIEARKDQPYPRMSSALAAANALKMSVERRTTGPDGYPLRQ